MYDAAYISRIAAIVGTGALVVYLTLAYRFLLPGIVSALQPPLQQLFHPSTTGGNMSIDLGWYAPSSSWITNLTQVVNGTGVHDFIFNSSSLPMGMSYGAYDWCNMPHVRIQEYAVPEAEYELQYVELIHRHHKRTPYAANTFPKEGYSWDCSDEGLFYYGQRLGPDMRNAATGYWQVFNSSSNPLAPSGFNGSCQFPQITSEGLDDSYQHGKDLFGVYHDLLNFIPSTRDDTVSYRVTNNVITSQVAGMVVAAMYPNSTGPFPFQIQPASIDSLEPAYPCTLASSLAGNYSTGSSNVNWTLHLNVSQALYNQLDAISGVSPTNAGFHQSWDHYYDNLSARQCHGKPLPCNITDPTLCVNQDHANEVYRLGQYEYSYIYRGAAQSLAYASKSYGIWPAELVQHMRDVTSGASEAKYRHNIAHDGSVSRLLSILQIDSMVWPGMGSEVVFEVWKKSGKNYLRVLWGGRVLQSSNPTLGTIDMLDLDTFFAYIDGLVGVGANRIPGLCNAS